MSVILPAKHVKRVYILNVLRYGHDINKIQIWLLHVPCVVRSLRIRWLLFIKIWRDGRLGFRCIKERIVKDVESKILREVCISVWSVRERSCVNYVIKAINILITKDFLLSIWWVISGRFFLPGLKKQRNSFSSHSNRLQQKNYPKSIAKNSLLIYFPLSKTTILVKPQCSWV